MKTWEKLRNNPSLWKRYFIREKVLTAIRRFFADRGFHEIETPYLTASLPPESYLEVFETTLYSPRPYAVTGCFYPHLPNRLLKNYWLPASGIVLPSPKSFRNTEDTSHHP